MKVIAQIDSTKVLCEVHVDEIGKLHGTSGPYDKAWDNSWTKVGAEHNLASAFRTLETLRGFDVSQLKYLKSRINDVSKAYDSVADAYEKLMLLDTLKEINSEESK